MPDQGQGQVLRREVSGLKSDKYLWRYTKLTDEQVEQAVTGLYDDLG